MITDILYYTCIFPLEQVLEWLLNRCFIWTRSSGGGVILASLLINLILFKLFLYTDKKAKEEADLKARLDARIKGWKSVYKGAKLYAFTHTLYRQNRYHPIFALRSLGGLAIQIPFFWAMYLVIKNCARFKTQGQESFLYISDLAKPDVIHLPFLESFLHSFSFLSNFSLHFLPILMTIFTLINVFYTSKALAARLQGSFIALIFLVILYDMPSALVLYWCVNMFIAMVKTLIYHFMGAVLGATESGVVLGQNHSGGVSGRGRENENTESKKADSKNLDSKNSQCDFLSPTHHPIFESSPTRFTPPTIVEGGVQGLGGDENENAESNHLGGSQGLGCDFIKKDSRDAIKPMILESNKITESKNMDLQNQDSQNAIFSSPACFTPPESVAESKNIDSKNQDSNCAYAPAAHPQGCDPAPQPTQVVLESSPAPHPDSNNLHSKPRTPPTKVTQQTLHTAYKWILLNISFMICVFSALSVYSSGLNEFKTQSMMHMLLAFMGSFGLVFFILMYAKSFFADDKNESKNSANISEKTGKNTGKKRKIKGRFKARFYKFSAVFFNFLLLIGFFYTFFFTGNYGVMSYFVFDNAPSFTHTQAIFDIFMIIFCAALGYFSLRFRLYIYALKVLFIVMCAASLANAYKVVEYVSDAGEVQSLDSNFSSEARGLGRDNPAGAVLGAGLESKTDSQKIQNLESLESNETLETIESKNVNSKNLDSREFKNVDFQFKDSKNLDSQNTNNLRPITPQPTQAVDSLSPTRHPILKINPAVAHPDSQNATFSSPKPLDPTQVASSPASKTPSDMVFSFSKTQKNILVIILDRADGAYFKEYVESKNYDYLKKYFDNFTGFTYFDNMLSTSGSTLPTITSTIAGEYYSALNINKRNIKDSLSDEMARGYAGIFNAFHDSGYFSAGIVDWPVGYKELLPMLKDPDHVIFDYKKYVEHYKNNHQREMVKYADDIMPLSKLISVSVFKFLPYTLRPNVYTNGDWFLSAKRSIYVDSIAIVESFRDLMDNESQKPTFKFIHSSLTHPQYIVDSQCNLKSTPQDVMHRNSEKCAIKMLSQIFVRMKSLGIYDNSEIFITSDHGADYKVLPPKENFASPFFYKPINASGALKINHANIANYDMASIFCSNISSLTPCPHVYPNVLKHLSNKRELLAYPIAGWRFENQQKNKYNLVSYWLFKGGDIYDSKNWEKVDEGFAYKWLDKNSHSLNISSSSHLNPTKKVAK